MIDENENPLEKNMLSNRALTENKPKQAKPMILVKTHKDSSAANQVMMSEEERVVFDSAVQIDDPELLTSKKHLTTKLSPLGMIQALKDKHKNLTFLEDM